MDYLTMRLLPRPFENAVELPQLSTTPDPISPPPQLASETNPQLELPPPAAPGEGAASSSAPASASPHGDADAADAQGPPSSTASMPVHVSVPTDRRAGHAGDEDIALLPPTKPE